MSGVRPIFPADALAAQPRQPAALPPPTPEEWQQYLQNALAALRTNPKDTEALEAIRTANEALNSFEQLAIEAGERLENMSLGEQALAGAGGALRGVTLDPVIGMAKLGGKLLTAPEEVPEMLVESIQGIGEGLTSGDPSRIGRSVGNIGAFALPSAKVTKGGPTVAGAVTAPFRAAGELMQRPALRNAALREQQALTATRRVAAEQSAAGKAARMPQETGILQARLRTLEQQLAQRASRGPLAEEGLALANEAARLRIELLRRQLYGEEAALPEEAVMTQEPMGAPAPRPTGATPVPLMSEIEFARALGTPEEAIASRLAERGVTPEQLRPTEQMAQTSPRGFEVTGTRPTPKVPSEPTLTEMQQGLTPSMVQAAEAVSAKARSGAQVTPVDLAALNVVRRIRGLPELTVEDILAKP